MSAKRKPTKRRKRPEPKSPKWILVRKGFYSRIMADVVGDGVMRKCCPVFYSREDARSFIDPEDHASGVRPAEIGSLEMPGGHLETLGMIAAAAAADGCDFMLAMRGRGADGEIIWGIADLTPDGRWKQALADKFTNPPL